LAAALSLTAVACGGEESSDADEAAGRYPVKVTAASFPPRQKLGETSLMRLAVRNTGRRTIPALTVTVTVGGKAGRNSNIPFAIRDPQPRLAQPDRPVWVPSLHYPKFAGSEEPGGATTSNPKTYSFGELKPGATANVVWKLSAARTGSYALLYDVDAGLGGEAKAVTTGGVKPGGSFTVRISSRPQDREVTGSGEVKAIDDQG
jgi:hypothetical protein